MESPFKLVRINDELYINPRYVVYVEKLNSGKTEIKLGDGDGYTRFTTVTPFEEVVSKLSNI